MSIETRNRKVNSRRYGYLILFLVCCFFILAVSAFSVLGGISIYKKNNTPKYENSICVSDYTEYVETANERLYLFIMNHWDEKTSQNQSEYLIVIQDINDEVAFNAISVPENPAKYYFNDNYKLLDMSEYASLFTYIPISEEELKSVKVLNYSDYIGFENNSDKFDTFLISIMYYILLHISFLLVSCLLLGCEINLRSFVNSSTKCLKWSPIIISVIGIICLPGLVESIISLCIYFFSKRYNDKINDRNRLDSKIWSVFEIAKIISIIGIIMAFIKIIIAICILNYY